MKASSRPTHLKPRSKPEGNNGVFVELSPDVQNRHDERDHEQLKQDVKRGQNL